MIMQRFKCFLLVLQKLEGADLAANFKLAAKFSSTLHHFPFLFKMNYFEFYNIPVSFNVDKSALKRTFYANSKKSHPDFYTLESEEKQLEVLELSTLNNKAYKSRSL